MTDIFTTYTACMWQLKKKIGHIIYVNLSLKHFNLQFNELEINQFYYVCVGVGTRQVPKGVFFSHKKVENYIFSQLCRFCL